MRPKLSSPSMNKSHPVIWFEILGRHSERTRQPINWANRNSPNRERVCRPKAPTCQFDGSHPSKPILHTSFCSKFTHEDTRDKKYAILSELNTRNNTIKRADWLHITAAIKRQSKTFNESISRQIELIFYLCSAVARNQDSKLRFRVSLPTTQQNRASK